MSLGCRTVRVQRKAQCLACIQAVPLVRSSVQCIFYFKFHSSMSSHSSRAVSLQMRPAPTGNPGVVESNNSHILCVHSFSSELVETEQHSSALSYLNHQQTNVDISQLAGDGITSVTKLAKKTGSVVGCVMCFMDGSQCYWWQ